MKRGEVWWVSFVSKQWLTNRIGRVSHSDMEAIEHIMAIQLGLA